MIFSRLLAASSVTVFLGSVAIVACGSPPAEESSAESSEGLSKAPVCPSWGCGRSDPFLPPSPSCSTWPRSLDADPSTEYTNPWVASTNPGQGLCHQDMAFTPAMVAFNCQPEFYYQATPGGLVEPVALCPGVPPLTVAIAPDSCTGEPPSGWSFVTWSYTIICQQPGSGCHSGACATF